MNGASGGDRSAIPDLTHLLWASIDNDDSFDLDQLTGRASAIMRSSLMLARQPGWKGFDAIVTGASGKGAWARLLTIPVEGKVMRGFEGVDVGDRIRVQLMAVDVERGYIDFK